MKNQKLIKRAIFSLLIITFAVFVCLRIVSCHISDQSQDLADLEYEGEISVELNNGIPEFTKEEIKRAKKEDFEEYSKLDKYGRCGCAMANVCAETMPGEDDERSSIGSIYPSGWQSINFWSRCHLLGYQLTGENDNERNLITGTSRMNLAGMLPYENKIAAYIDENINNHVLLKVEPVFDGTQPVAKGVHMQALSVEDEGEGISINVYIFNYQPGYIIDYSNGKVKDDPDHQTIITLKDTEAKYNGEPIESGKAEVSGSTGTVKYIYFVDKETSNKTNVLDGAETNGAAPSMPGTYYVKAVVSGDNYYPSAASNTAELIIRE